MIGCLRTHVRNQPIIALYFEFETEPLVQVCGLICAVATVIFYLVLVANTLGARPRNLAFNAYRLIVCLFVCILFVCLS